MKASIVITTRNRKDELRVAVASALQQSAQPEVIVVDDGSTDGTADFVRANFPQVKLHHFGQSKGYISRRNEGARLAQGDVIFSIDDDAAFSSENVVQQTLLEFDHPRIGAVAIPYVERHKTGRLLQKAPEGKKMWVTDRFVGTAHALRRDVFLRLGGYREDLVHQGEESDFCIRLLASGYAVRLGNADPIHHFESAKRDFSRMDYFGRRNDVLFAWHNVPRPWLLIHLFVTTYNGLRAGLSVSRPFDMLRGTINGYLDCWRHRRQRAPVSEQTYRLYRRLRKHGPLHFEEIESLIKVAPNPSIFDPFFRDPQKTLRR